MFGSAQTFGGGGGFGAAAGGFGQPAATGGFGAAAGGFGAGAFGQKPAATGGFGAPAAGAGFGASTGGFGAQTTQTGFGQAATPAFGAAAGGFGKPAGTFGQQPATGGFGAATGGFGAATQQTGGFGAAGGFGSGGGFGTTTTAPTGGFGAPATGAFGAAAPAQGGFGGGFGATQAATPSFGAAASTGFGAAAASSAGFGFGKGQPATGGFGAQPASTFGAAGGGFGGGAFGGMGVGTGTGQSAYTETDWTETGTTGSNKLLAITAMPAYANKSFEELRWEDYQAGKKQGRGSAPTGTGAFGTPAAGFGQQPAQPAGLFGASTTPAFGAATQTPAFGAAAQTPAFGAAQTPAFGATTHTPAFGATQTPAFGATQTPAFGAATQAPAFGATQTPAFGATTQTPAFGAAAQTPAFGATTQTPAFSATNTFGSAAQPAAGGFGAASGGGFGGLGGLGASTGAPAFAATTTSTAPVFGGLGGFGTTQATAAGAGSQPSTTFTGFGGATATPAPFGAPTSSAAPFGGFGSTTTSAAPAFGSTAPTLTLGGATPFGAASTVTPFSLNTKPALGTAPTATGLFGATSTPAATPFGATTGGLFGAKTPGQGAAQPGAQTPVPIAQPQTRPYTPLGNLQAVIDSARKGPAPSTPTAQPQLTLQVATPQLLPSAGGAAKARALAPEPPARVFTPQATRTLTRKPLPGTAVALANGHKAPANGVDSPVASKKAGPDLSIAEFCRGGGRAPIPTAVRGPPPSTSLHKKPSLFTISDPEVYTEPSLSELQEMSTEQLKRVRRFTVFHRQHGQVEFTDPVDVTSFAGLHGDTPLDQVVVFGPKTVDVYPEALGVCPEAGKGLMVGKKVALYNCHPKKYNTAEWDSSKEAAYNSKLARLADSMGATSCHFDWDSGCWTFFIPAC